MDFNKLTLKSQEAVAAAQELARRMGNPELYPEHLVLALLDHLQIDAAVVGGVSMGGYVSLALLRSDPARVKALVAAAHVPRPQQPVHRQPPQVASAQAADHGQVERAGGPGLWRRPHRQTPEIGVRPAVAAGHV